MLPTIAHRRTFLKLTGGTLALAAWPAGRVFGEDVKQLKRLKVYEQHPYNAEPEIQNLLGKYITPLESFYVRSHGKEDPKLDAETFRLEVSGLVERPLTLSLPQLKEKFKAVTTAATLTCAGNRRAEFAAVKAASGVQWEGGAIGNAVWQGITLAEVLTAAGIKPAAKHVWFEALDAVEHDGQTAPFGGSIPLARAMNTAKDAPPVMLAYGMNDAPLRPEHGFPLRSLVPGFIGARSVKWLGKVIVSDRPSTNYFLDGTYKLVQTSSQEEIAQASPIQENVINSAICRAEPIDGGGVRIAGYAIPSGQPGAKIAKVEVSTDGGKAWQPAKFDAAQNTIAYGWVLWSLDAKLPAGDHTLLVRATDTAGQTQPQTPKWNAKGYLFNGWYQVPYKS